MDHRKLIDVGEHGPVVAGGLVALGNLLQRLPLRAFARFDLLGDVAQHTMARELRQKLIAAVRAIVREEKEIRDTDQPVIGDPFQQERAFVADAGEGKDRQRASPRQKGQPSLADLLPVLPSRAGCATGAAVLRKCKRPARRSARALLPLSPQRARIWRNTRVRSCAGASESRVARQQTWWSGRTSRQPESRISDTRAHSPE